MDYKEGGFAPQHRTADAIRPGREGSNRLIHCIRMADKLLEDESNDVLNIDAALNVTPFLAVN